MKRNCATGISSSPLPVSIKDSKRTQVLASVVKLSTATTFQLSMKFLSQQPTWSTVIIVQHQIQLVPFTHRWSYFFSLYFSVLPYCLPLSLLAASFNRFHPICCIKTISTTSTNMHTLKDVDT